MSAFRKPGRNEPCPCGSGRKHKHCCLATAARAEESPAEITWRRIRRALDGYAATMTRFVVDTYGEQAVDEAWSEFMCWDDDADVYDPGSPHMQMFMPWLFHAWAPDPFDTDIEDESLHDRTPTSVFLEQRGARLDPVLRRYLGDCLEAPFSFFEITACEPGRGFNARDLLTGEQFDVLEHSASETIRTGEMIFAQIVRIDGIALLEAAPPCSLPPMAKLAVLEVREKIRRVSDPIVPDTVRDYDMELRELYLDLTDATLNPGLPELHNTDGDPLVPHRLSFDIDSADEAFAALKHLAFEQDETELLHEAERETDGRLQRVSFGWLGRGNAMNPGMENTLLGHIEIDGRRLHCEVNSEKRAAAFRELVEKALGEAARIRPTAITPLEPQLADALARRRSGDAPAPARSEHDELMQIPEVREQLHAMIAAHYEKWIDEKLPALAGRTPREAMRSKAGREQVETLVQQIEYDGTRMNPPLDPAIVQMLRSRLGLE